MVCLDTSFLVNLIRGNEETEGLLKHFILEENKITITSPSIMEIVSGASLDKSARQEKERIFDILSSLQVMDLGAKEATSAGEIQAELILSGSTIGDIDILIGAIARENDETLVTRNKKHFEKIPGLKIEIY